MQPFFLNWCLQISLFIQVLSRWTQQNSSHGQTGPQPLLSTGANHAIRQHPFMPMPRLPGRRLHLRLPGSNRHRAKVCHAASLHLRRGLRVHENSARLPLRLTLIGTLLRRCRHSVRRGCRQANPSALRRQRLLMNAADRTQKHGQTEFDPEQKKRQLLSIYSL
jgi:hypothetical protein